MKKIILRAIAIALLATSCKKQTKSSSQTLNTPIHAVIPNQYISVDYIGADESNPQLIVDFAAYKPQEDCNKKVFDAAEATVSGSTKVSKVTVKGTNLKITFERGANLQPSKLALTYNTDLYKAAYTKWNWSGFLMVENQNKVMTKADFEKAVNVSVRAINTGDEAKITDQYIVNNTMFVRYAITKSSVTDPSLSYEVQSSTPITLTSQVKINCLIPGFIEPKGDLEIDWMKGLVPTVKDLGNGVKSYRQEIHSSLVNQSLEEYIARRYFVEKVSSKF